MGPYSAKGAYEANLFVHYSLLSRITSTYTNSRACLYVSGQTPRCSFLGSLMGFTSPTDRPPRSETMFPLHTLELQNLLLNSSKFLSS